MLIWCRFNCGNSAGWTGDAGLGMLLQLLLEMKKPVQLVLLLVEMPLEEIMVQSVLIVRLVL